MTGSSSTQPRRIVGGGLVVAILSIVHALAFHDRLLVALLAPAIKQSLVLSDFELGIVQGTAFALAFAFGSLVLTARRFTVGGLPMVAVGLATWTVGIALCGLAQSFLVMCVARMLIGAGQATLSPSALSIIGGVVRRERLGRAISIYTSAATLGRSAALLGGGAVLAFVGVPILGQASGWRAVFFLAVLPNVLLSAGLYAIRTASRVLTDQRQGPDALLPWMKAHRRTLAAHVLASIATVLVIQTATAWATTLLVRQHGFTIARAGSVFGLVVLVVAPLGHLVGGVVLDRVARGAGSLASAVVMACGLLVCLPFIAVFGLATDVTLVVAALTIFSFVLGIVSPAGLVGLQRMCPPELRSRATAGFLACVTTVSFGFGPPALGLLTDVVFGKAGIGAALLTVSVVATAACGSTLVWAARPSLRD